MNCSGQFLMNSKRSVEVEKERKYIVACVILQKRVRVRSAFEEFKTREGGGIEEKQWRRFFTIWRRSGSHSKVHSRSFLHLKGKKL